MTIWLFRFDASNIVRRRRAKKSSCTSMCWDEFDKAKRKDVNVSPVVISMHGLVTTFIRLLPEDILYEYSIKYHWGYPL
jgi:hypothetical protein